MSRITVNAHPHAGQLAVHNDPARFKVLAAGRRWGKTRLGVNECIDIAAHGGRAWWVAPSYKVSEVGWRAIRRMGGAMGAQISKVDRTITLSTGGQIGVRSADNPDSLRGDGLDFAVFDEVAFMKEEAWTEAIRPALSDRKGGALFISTPKGRNWFWRLYQAAQDDDEWAAWRFRTVDNPHIDPAEVEAARKSLPDRVFRQEYLAEFIEDGAGVFRRVSDCIGAVPLDSGLDGHNYVMGVDWAKSNDFTVLTVLDIDTKEVVHIDRFNQIDYAIQRGRLQGLAARFNVNAIIAERNSIGEPNIEILQRAGLPVQGFTTTNATKQQIIEALVIAFENGDISIPADDVLVNELMSYEAERRASGAMVYNAPSGLHDDMVMSLALAWRGVHAGSFILFGA